MSNFSNKGFALITGASSGIGAVYADRLAKRGYDLILVARTEARMKSLSARLTSETGRSVKVLPTDLNNRAKLSKVEAMLRNDPSITMLVNNACTASVAPLLDADVEKMEEMIALNITALTRLTYAAAPAFVAHGAGIVINIGSVVGISPEALNGVYGATDLWEIAGLPWQKLPPSIVMSVEDMVDAALVGLDQGERVTIPGLQDGDEWTRFEAARRAISQRFGNSLPAPRYGIPVPPQQRA